MAMYAVDSDAVMAAETAAKACSERVRGDVAAMHAQLQNLQSVWSGSASNAFQGTLEEWRVVQRSVEDALDRLNLALGVSGRSYADTESAVMGMFR